MKKLLLILLALALSSASIAHSGRTDAYGGHKDNKNVSGLGAYHYHCGANPAHLHKDGKCPYKKPTKPATPPAKPTTKK